MATTSNVTPGGQSDTSVQIEKESVHAAGHCVPDTEKIPADETTVHIKSQNSRQGDGLLQITKTCIGSYSESPVYKVDFKGKVDDPKTNMIWYFKHTGECTSCTLVFLHMLDPSEDTSRAEGQSQIPLDKYKYRLCRYKVQDEYMLAVHKAPQAVHPFGPDNDGIMDICYYVSKGGMITLKPTDGKLIGTTEDGEARLFNESAQPDYSTNPFTLFYIYKDEVKELKRMNGEL